MAGLGLGQTTHVIVHDEDTWSVVEDACPPAASSVFLANGQLYLAWAEETELVWSRVE